MSLRTVDFDHKGGKAWQHTHASIFGYRGSVSSVNQKMLKGKSIFRKLQATETETQVKCLTSYHYTRPATNARIFIKYQILY